MLPGLTCCVSSIIIFLSLPIYLGCPLFHIGIHVFQTHNLFERFNLDIMKVHKFLTSVESNYHEENAYHNSTHAADVTQAVHCLLQDPLVSLNHNPFVFPFFCFK